MAENPRLDVDIVIPVFNEAGLIERIHGHLCDVLGSIPHNFRIIYVDDGSSDGTADTLRRIADADRRISLLQLSRNFGHQAALTAGMDAATGDVIITMDGDGQHPPEMILQMLNLIQQGYDIVQTQRIDEGGAATFKKVTSNLFYRLINIISGTQVLQGAADFRALSRDALNGLKSMHEYHRFLRGMISWMGYASVILPYHEPERLAGQSKYSLGKMMRLASDAVFSFSLAPLYIGLSSGLAFLVLAVAQMLWVAYLWLTGQTGRIVAGWSSLMAISLIASGIIMILLGFIGVYVGYIFQEVKRRPIYLVKGGKNKDGEQ
ncbi:MAG: glycosyltransferase family 2 protein [Anaerolineales bacterium]|nr:glycosyltransferase family 2 protein [Anaerolineales bacterium]MBP6207912.1 glycosyltransferase family 2 protein [Anaerolineales bacterium]MBP8164651.1 glycosyltransferase family 2 protein [Anaerolineales bacterium]